jgi:hypothetical protein
VQYGGEGDWSEGDVAAHNAVKPVLQQIERLWAAMRNLEQRADALEAARTGRTGAMRPEPPDRTIVVDRRNVAWQRLVGQWYAAGGDSGRDWAYVEGEWGPVTELWPPLGFKIKSGEL